MGGEGRGGLSVFRPLAVTGFPTFYNFSKFEVEFWNNIKEQESCQTYFTLHQRKMLLNCPVVKKKQILNFFIKVTFGEDMYRIVSSYNLPSSSQKQSMTSYYNFESTYASAHAAYPKRQLLKLEQMNVMTTIV